MDDLDDVRCNHTVEYTKFTKKWEIIRSSLASRHVVASYRSELLAHVLADTKNSLEELFKAKASPIQRT